MSRTIVITGASSGIGAAGARALAAHGDQVVLVGRSPETTPALAAELGAPHHLADFADLAQVRSLAADLLAAYPRIDVLVNNAGGISPERAVTGDGFERTFQLNHLAPFLLTHLLTDRLVADRALVVNTASAAAHTGRLDLDTVADPPRWSAFSTYGDGKLANVLHAAELHRRHGERGLRAASFHPGAVATGFGADSGGMMAAVLHGPLRHWLLTTPERGAETMLWLIDPPAGAQWQPGGHHVRRRVARAPRRGRDTALAAALWERSLAWVGEKDTSASPSSA